MGQLQIPFPNACTASAMTITQVSSTVGPTARQLIHAFIMRGTIFSASAKMAGGKDIHMFSTSVSLKILLALNMCQTPRNTRLIPITLGRLLKEENAQLKWMQPKESQELYLTMVSPTVNS